MEMGFWPKIEFSENQPEQEEGKPRRCSFDVSCTWSIKLSREKVLVSPPPPHFPNEHLADLQQQIDLDPFPLIINVPEQWEDLWKEIGVALANSLDK